MPPRAAGNGARSRPGTAPVAALAFLVVATGVVVHNRRLFHDRMLELGDAAANSVLVDAAKHLTLLTGHYSRVGFHHPGPAVLYLQAAGEALFYDLLHVVPTPYNGQVLAIVGLQAAVVAAVVAAVHSWWPRWSVAAAALATVVAWQAAHDYTLTATWMPLVVVGPFLLLMVAAASVAAGRAGQLWLLAAVGGLLVHAHVEFALFVPVLATAAVATWAVSTRSTPRQLWREHRRNWLAALGVVALFLLPIALDMALHWPGEVSRYIGYTLHNQRAGHRPGLLDALAYARQFWVPGHGRWNLVPPLLVSAAAAAAWTAPSRLRRPLLYLTGSAVLAEALFVLYALKGIDDLTQAYVGTFSTSVPLALLLVVVTALAARLPAALSPAVVALAAVVTAVALTGRGVDLRAETTATFPSTLAAVQAAVGPAPVALDIGPGAGPFLDGMGLLESLTRAGTPTCVLNPELRVQVSTARLCTPQQAAAGRRVLVEPTGSVPQPTARDQFSDVLVVR